MIPAFSSRLVQWQQTSGRHHLPWQVEDPYPVWVSEIMLQQTQVGTVIPYFERFMKTLPTLKALAEASEETVLSLWSGLGYYTRARNLHRAAQTIQAEYSGVFPTDMTAVQALSGIGRSTAAAICALAFGQRHAILDGNVRRVLARHAGIAGWTGDKKIEAQLWEEAEKRLPEASEIRPYTQGLMDLGSQVCTRSRPQCLLCPLQADCVAHLTGQTALLPTPRPKKIQPERSVFLFEIYNENKALLLEKRPSKGIWGGLWSLPEHSTLEAGLEHCLEAGWRIESFHQKPSFLHVFTHFRLTIQPVVIQLNHLPETGQWFSLSDALALGLPAPIRGLLAEAH